MGKINNFITTLFVFIIIPGNVSAQLAINTDTDILIRKRELSEVFNVPIVPSGNKTLVLIKPRAVRHFLNNFTEAKNENWSVINHGYKVQYMWDGVLNAVYYDPKGYWSEIIKKFPEDKLPYEVTDLFKKRYYEDTFLYAESIEIIQSDKEPTYAVYVENEKSLKCLRIYGGVMELVKEIYKK